MVGVATAMLALAVSIFIHLADKSDAVQYIAADMPLGTVSHYSFSSDSPDAHCIMKMEVPHTGWHPHMIMSITHE